MDGIIITREAVLPRKSGYAVRYRVDMPDGPVRAVHNIRVIVCRGRTTIKQPCNVALSPDVKAAIYEEFSHANLVE